MDELESKESEVKQTISDSPKDPPRKPEIVKAKYSRLGARKYE